MEHEKRHQDLDHLVEELEEESERLEDHIQEARHDWESKQGDRTVPGAQPDEDDEEGDGPPPEANPPQA